MNFRTSPDIFRDRKIPKHLIIREEYETRRKPGVNLIKWLFWGFTLAGIAYMLLRTVNI